MKPNLERLRPRLDKFAKTEELRKVLAELGVDDCGIYLLLCEYGFPTEAKHYCNQGGLKSLRDEEIKLLGDLFTAYYLVDDRLENLKWSKGLNLAAKIITFLKPLPLPVPVIEVKLDKAETYLQKWDPEYKTRKRCWKGIVN